MIPAAAMSSTAPPASPPRAQYASELVVVPPTRTAPLRLPDILIAGQLHTFGHHDLADEVLRVLELARDDEEYVDSDSLQHFVDFVLANLFPAPSFGLTHDGNVQVTWRLESGPVATAAFWPRGVVRYAVASRTGGVLLTGLADIQTTAHALIKYLSRG